MVRTRLPARARSINQRIHLVRGHKVMLDADLAELYGVETRALNQAVTRNSARFPSDFMFHLSPGEHRSLRSQLVILERGRGQHRKYPPLAFTEQGVAMLSSVLRSERAIQVNVEIMRAFVRMRGLAVSYADLEGKLEALEQKYDAQFKVVFDAMRQLMEPPPSAATRPIGFRGNDEP